MKSIKSVLFLLALIILCPSVKAGKIFTDTIQSKILKTDMQYNVYLPKGFDAGSHQKYPIFYLLHGLYGDHTDWVVKGGMQAVTDELMESGEAVPMIIIMPQAGLPEVSVFQNGYFNMEGWAYEDYFFKELMPYVEKKYHVQGDKEHRAICGLSMGGGGSISYCERHPEMFSSCYALSGWLDVSVDESKRPDAKKDKLVKEYFSVHDHNCIDFLKNINDDVKAKLRTVKWFVDCGDEDFTLELNENFVREMRRNEIPCEFRVRNGSHSWEYWHTGLRTSLPFASRNFSQK